MVTHSVLYGLVAAAIVGTSVFTMALATRRVRLLQVLFWAKLGSVVVATLYLAIARDTSDLSLGQWSQIVIICLVGLSGYITYLMALKAGPVAIVAPIVSGEGAVVIILAVLLAGERLTIGQSLGASAAVGGVALATVDLRRLSSGQRLIGKGAALATYTMVTFGLVVYVIARLAQDVGWFYPAFGFNLVTFAMITPAVAVRRQVPWRGLTLGLVAMMMIAGVLETLGFFVFYRGAEDGIITIITAAITAYPLVPIMGGVLMFRERLAVNQMIGVVSVFGGLLLLSLV